MLWRIYGLTAAVANQLLAINEEFIALRMTAKVVMIVENQNLRLRPHPLPVEACRRES